MWLSHELLKQHIYVLQAWFYTQFVGHRMFTIFFGGSQFAEINKLEAWTTGMYHRQCGRVFTYHYGYK